MSRLASDAGLGVLGFVTWRSLVGMLTLAALLSAGLALGRAALPAPGSVRGRQRWVLIITGVVNLLTNIAVFAAFGTSAVAVVVIILYSYPALVTLGANRLWGEPIDRARALALLLASAGLALVVLGPVLGGATIRMEPWGLALAAAAAVLQAAYTLLVARGFPAIPSLVGSTLILVIVVVGNVAVTLLVGLGWQLSAPVEDPSLVGWVLLAGVLGAGIPGVAQTMGIRRLGASRASILMMLEPVMAVVMAALFLAERPSPVQLAGGLMVITAGVILQLPERRIGGRRRAETSA